MCQEHGNVSMAALSELEERRIVEMTSSHSGPCSACGQKVSADWHSSMMLHGSPGVWCTECYDYHQYWGRPFEGTSAQLELRRRWGSDASRASALDNAVIQAVQALVQHTEAGQQVVAAGGLALLDAGILSDHWGATQPRWHVLFAQQSTGVSWLLASMWRVSMVQLAKELCADFAAYTGEVNKAATEYAKNRARMCKQQQKHVAVWTLCGP